MDRVFFRVAAWALLAAIVLVTVSPIGLRPHTITTVNLDRAAAYAVMTFVFTFAYPRQWKWVLLFCAAAALGLELAQELSPTRHARLHDAVIKVAGTLCGSAAYWVLTQIRARRLG
ncbi:VanZ family protein [Rhizobium sp. PAMB 3182]